MTNTPNTVIKSKRLPHIKISRIPYLIRQKTRVTLTGQTLRPGGLTPTCNAVDFCGFEPGDLILDAGCGYGMTARYLKETHGINVLAIDSERDILEQARQKQTQGKEKISFIQTRLPALPFQSHAFTGVFCEGVLSLVSDKKKCLKEFLRLLKPNGKLILTDLYIPQLSAHRFSSTRKKNKTGYCLDGALPIIELMSIVEKAGFKINLIEDHTQILKQPIGQKIFKYGSQNNFGGRQNGPGKSPARRTGRLRPGYCTIIAGKYA